VARNRKRAKDRRTRRPPQAGGSQSAGRSSVPGVLPGVPTVTDEPSRELEPEDNGTRQPVEPDFVLEPEDSDPADPLRHAAPDAELAEAQMAYGAVPVPEPAEGPDEEEFELEVDESISAGRGGRGGGGYDRDELDGAGGEAAAPAPVHAEHRANIFARLIGFLQGCWRELQRVQWPDRRQVMQATGVVIGFVIVAAIFLGVADWASGKIVTFILK
jgi:preprotein translocase subunit SecE